ncbi:MAG: beta-propeller domain-containing protein [Candidatus Thiodiazotropha sp. (ex Epidulcina cf. delphinae)]|nr:beta-propeller domain-containing protein [Candidatus Thiodiazotropha sp. (ex Epidulcina cf. delphinae)]
MSNSITGSIGPLFLVVVLALLSGCRSSGNGDDSAFQYRPQLQTFNHCDDLESYLIETAQKQQQLLAYTQTLPIVSLDDVTSGTPTENGADDTDSPSAINDLTGTNNQVTGVDEADFVKTNGDYTYLLSGGYFIILKTWPAAQSEEVSRTKIEGEPRALFVHEAIAWIVSDLSQADYLQLPPESLSADFSPRLNQLSRISLFQISDPQLPVLIRKTTLESEYSDARMIGHQVYLIVSAYLDLSPVLDDAESIGISDLLPEMTDNTAPSQSGQTTTALVSECDAIHRPETANGTGTLTILSFDLKSPLSDIPSQSILSNTGMVYATQNHLYVASIEDQFWTWLPVMEGEEEQPIPGTTIHKFSLQSMPQYLASGRVEGRLINQFAMDEHQGVLRLVTTEQNWWTTADPENRLFILEQSGNQLIQRSHLEGLGKPGDRIYAARFIQEKGFLVTFRQIDPFYTLDLSDSYRPVVAGELEVPGFSTYLHPIDEDLILAIGRDTNLGGLKLSLFDIGDFQQPELLYDHLIGAGSYSEAEYNHHAFTWFAREQMLAIPVTRWNRSLSEPISSGFADIFNGLELFEVTREQGIQPYASIDHDIFYWDESGQNWYHPEGIRRSFFVSDDSANSYLYSVSSRGFLVNDLASPGTNLAAIALPAYNNNYFEAAGDF